MAIGTTAAILGGTLLGGAASMIGSSKAAKATESAAATSAQAQTAQLEYLKEINALPQELREQALTQIGGLAGLDVEGGLTSAQLAQESLAAAQASPFYGSMVETGEQAVLRGASATGGLRSGAASRALAETNQAVLQNLYEQERSQRLSSLQGLAGLSTGASEIGQVMANIGQTQAAGTTGAAQAWQQGLQNVTNIGLTGLGTAISQGVI